MEISIEVEKEGEDKEPKEWEIESWCRTICDAEKIKADPEKMAYVKPMMEKMMNGTKAAYKSIKSLKAKANEMAKAEADGEMEE